MGIVWIDKKEGREMGKNIITRKRLYDTDANGIRFLKYPAGAQVPEDEYKRLCPGTAPVIETMKRQPVENKTAPKPNQKSLKSMNKAQLVETALSMGINVNESMTNREIIEAIQGE